MLRTGEIGVDEGARIAEGVRDAKVHRAGRILRLAEGDVIEGSARVDQPPPRRRIYEESTQFVTTVVGSRVSRDICAVQV